MYNSKFWTTEQFFNRVNYFIAKRKMSLHELSCEMETSISTLYKLRKSTALPKMQTICAICDVLEIKLWEFFATEDDITPEMSSVISDMRSVSLDGQKALAQMVKHIK